MITSQPTQPKTKMRIARTSVFTFILIPFTCLLISCDVPVEGPALYQILHKLKFRVTEISSEYPARLDRYDVLFLQALDKSPTEQEIRDIQNFVSTGSTLIVVGNNEALADLFLAYSLELQKLTKRQTFSRRIPAEPFFPERPVDELYTDTDFVIEAFGREVAALYGREDDVTVVRLRDGDGRAFFIASDYIFSNSGLRHSNNATFLYNLMSTVPRNARIGFAETRYYTVETKLPDAFSALLLRTPGGLAAIYICLTIFIFLVLRGRRFGRPLDAQQKNRRLSSEYVHAMTALYQKGSTRADILKHIREKFKVDLGARWRVNPNFDTATFLEELATRGAIDEDDELANLMSDLDTAVNLSEAQLLNLARRVETYRETAKIGKASSSLHRGF